ncbi:uncharacterized protein [Chelonus insularis]|uniref:uncharacterized protein n=1 Tax=Chelonus insularis TaxID=460826 RepID=UPI00158EDC3E|nr:uncharacterized protein LOC118073654 [Chelonus insularis]
MIQLFGLILCVCIFNQGESYVIQVNKLTPPPNSIIQITGSQELMSTKFDTIVTNYTINIGKDITKDNDMPISFEYYSNVDSYPDLVAEGTTTICSADRDDFDGTVATVLSQSLGIANDPPCPIKAGSYSQESLFAVDQGEFGNLFDDLYRTSVKLNIKSDFNVQMEISK